MEKRLITLDICGLDVDLILTDDETLLGGEDKAGNDADTEEQESFGKYSVEACKIWLAAYRSPSVMRSYLFHEIHEFVLAYYHLYYSVRQNHDSFSYFSNVLWEVMLRNQDVLFGNRLAELLQQMAKAEQEG